MAQETGRKMPQTLIAKKQDCVHFGGMASRGVIAVVAIAGCTIAIGAVVYIIRICLKAYRARLAEVRRLRGCVLREL
jgi:hypothetical protein